MQHLNNPFFKEFGVINIISTTHSHFYDILNKICSGSLKTGYRWPTLFIYVPHRACSQDIKGSSKCRPTSWHAQVRLLIPNVDTSVFFVMGSNRTISGLLLVLRTSIPFSKSLWVRTVAGAYHGHCWAKAWEQKYKINFFLALNWYLSLYPGSTSSVLILVFLYKHRQKKIQYLWIFVSTTCRRDCSVHMCKCFCMWECFVVASGFGGEVLWG